MQVPFFCNDEETPSTPKADALFIPRENPRALAIRPLEQWPGRANREERTPSKDMSRALENGNLSIHFASCILRIDSVHKALIIELTDSAAKLIIGVLGLRGVVLLIVN